MKIGILTNGSIRDYNFYKERLKQYDIIICADGGLNHAIKLGLIPHVALGDFDSTPSDLVAYFESKGTKIVRYSKVKDQTDTEIALDYAMDKNPASIDILSGIGSRFDHSLANVHLLKKALDRGAYCHIITENNDIMVIDSKVQLKGQEGEGVSLLPLTETVSGVYTNGLAYPIKDGILRLGAPYGVSNYMTHAIAEIKIDGGLLLVMKYRD